MNDQTILEEGQEVGASNDPLYGNSIVLSYNGALYPFRNGKMLNPLDPVELLCCLGTGEDDKAVETAMKICRTVDMASRIRENGYTIITRYNSGAPKAILESNTNNILILGALSKKENLLLPILSTQLSDEQYDQSRIDVWKERGFKTPRKYGIAVKTCSVDHLECDGWDEVEIQKLVYELGDISVAFFHTESGRREVSDDEDRDWDYEFIETDSLDISKVEPDPIPNKTEHPKFVWQDKGVENED